MIRCCLIATEMVSRWNRNTQRRIKMIFLLNNSPQIISNAMIKSFHWEERKISASIKHISSMYIFNWVSYKTFFELWKYTNCYCSRSLSTGFLCSKNRPRLKYCDRMKSIRSSCRYDSKYKWSIMNSVWWKDR